MFFCTSPLPETGSGVRLCWSFCARWLGTQGMQGRGLAQAQRLQMWQKKITKNITSSIRFFQIWPFDRVSFSQPSLRVKKSLGLCWRADASDASDARAGIPTELTHGIDGKIIFRRTIFSRQQKTYGSSFQHSRAMFRFATIWWTTCVCNISVVGCIPPWFHTLFQLLAHPVMTEHSNYYPNYSNYYPQFGGIIVGIGPTSSTEGYPIVTTRYVIPIKLCELVKSC